VKVSELKPASFMQFDQNTLLIIGASPQTSLGFLFFRTKHLAKILDVNSKNIEIGNNKNSDRKIIKILKFCLFIFK
jgi:hypothetical protein